MLFAQSVFLGVTLLGAPAVSSNPAQAAEPDRVRISLTAPPTCPEKSTFVAQISERVTIAWIADETELARQIEVVLEPSATGFEGRMQYVDESGRTVTRSLQAPDCPQAMAGIALVTAIAIESQAVQPGPSSEKPRAASEAMPSSAQPSPTEPTPAAPLPRAGPLSAPARQATSESASVVQEMGLLAGVLQGVGPGFALGGGALWGIGTDPFPTLRAIARYYETSDESSSTPDVTVYFRVISVGPEVCASRPLGASVALGLCAGVELGQFTAEGKTAAPERYSTRPYHLFWAAAELSAPLRLAGEAVFVELEPAARFPLVSGIFELKNPNEFVYEIPRLAFGLNLAAGFTFR